MSAVKYQEIEIGTGNMGHIIGDLSMTDEARDLIIFSHGSGSSRLSPRNKFVAAHLNRFGFATLLMDLLTVEEDRRVENRFDIDLLTQRLVDVTMHISAAPAWSFRNIGFFGASTGAASALKAAAILDDRIGAVVSRGGRPDLAIGSLDKVKCPVLLIVGSLDDDVLMLNRKAMTEMSCKKELTIIQGATHLFEEQGKMEEVAERAKNWFSLCFHPG